VDTDNTAKLLADLAGVTDRRAQFDCAAALVDGEYEHVEIGVWPGSVLEAPEGVNGFGYDPVFRPDGLPGASALLSAEQKNAISHRARAFGALVDVLRERYG
jgi:XTP/dITP diphosphohydrolase